MIKLRLKCLMILLAGIAAGLSLIFTGSHVSIAGNDDILTEIAGYKNWPRVNKDPITATTLSILNKESTSDPSAFVLKGDGG